MNGIQAKSAEPGWMRQVLMAAGIYNLVWGCAVVVFPAALFGIAGMELPRYPQIWQCVGMIVGVYGIGYLIAAVDPLRHWPITLVGLLGKIFGPIGFVGAVASGGLPLAFGITMITNDIIWWVPFAAILYQTWKRSNDTSKASDLDLAKAITTAVSHRGATLSNLSWRNPTLVVFLRHTGCTFCRETVADLAAQRAELESRGITLAVVHMSEPLNATQFLARCRLDSIHRFKDPHCELYQAFGLLRGSFLQLFGPRVWWRGIAAGLLKGHGIGPVDGDGFRMPGVFLLDRGKIVNAFRAVSAADQPDFLKIAALPEANRVQPGFPVAGTTRAVVPQQLDRLVEWPSLRGERQPNL